MTEHFLPHLKLTLDAIPFTASMNRMMRSKPKSRSKSSNCGRTLLAWFVAQTILMPIIMPTCSRKLNSVGIELVDAFVIRRPHTHTHMNTQTKIPATLPTTTMTTQLLCQLLGMNCANPTDFNFSFKGFAKRGGDTDIHSHGFGVAFYEGRGLRCFHDSEPACESPIASFLMDYPIRTLNMMAHIRYATQGEVSLANVHPFQREMWGIQWCFAHNGDVPLFKNGIKWVGQGSGDCEAIGNGNMYCPEPIYNPIGDTDSEAIFCSLLNALKSKFDTLPSLPVLHATLHTLCNDIVQDDPQSTIMNFLLTCGTHVQFVYSWPGSRPGSKIWNGLYYTIREPPFAEAHLTDINYSVNFARHTENDDRVAVIATSPLTKDEEWIELERGELILFDQGLPHKSPESLFRVELQGHGLNSTVIPPARLQEDMRRFKVDKNFFVGADI